MTVSSLTVFFPCYNEEANVERVVRGALEILPRLTSDFEIIVVDDGSRDRTAEVVSALASEHRAVRAVRHPSNQGYGAALISGFRAATKEWIFFTDGDGQFDLNDLPKLLERRAPGRAVLGYRVKRSEGFIRTVNARMWMILIWVLFGLKVRDLDCAFKLVHRAGVEGLQLRSQGAFISAELLLRLRRRGTSFEEVGIHHYPRRGGRPTGANIKVILRAFKELVQLWRELRREV